LISIPSPLATAVVPLEVPPSIKLISAAVVVIAVPAILRASVSTVPSKYASLNSKAFVPKSTIALEPGVKAPSVSINCFSLSA
jgi:hypothetical protein